MRLIQEPEHSDLSDNWLMASWLGLVAFFTLILTSIHFRTCLLLNLRSGLHLLNGSIRLVMNELVHPVECMLSTEVNNGLLAT